ncbi:unnamed protein product [Camellia sinensis]
MNHPKGITVDHRGNIYIADTLNMAIRKISDAGNRCSRLEGETKLNQSCLALLLALLLPLLFPLLFRHSRSFQGSPASSAIRASAMSTSSSQALTLWTSPPWVCDQRPSHRLFPSLPVESNFSENSFP